MSSNKPKKSDPLTVDEMSIAMDIFIKRFDVVKSRMPNGSSIEDILKVMENVAKLGHKLRNDKVDQEKLDRFGFIKSNDLDAIDRVLETSSVNKNFYWPPVGEPVEPWAQ